MTTLNHTVAAKARAAIDKSEKTQADIACAANIKHSTLRSKLQARSGFTVDELYRLAKTLGVSLIELLPTEENKNEKVNLDE